MKEDVKCVFCRIAAGDEPASVVYQDDLIVAFMALRPTRPGEFLIIPKEHVDDFFDLPADVACHIIKHALRLSKNLRTHFRPKRVGMVVHGFGVPHAHVIIVPQHEDSDITSGRHVVIEDGEVRFSASHLPIPERKELDRQAKLIRGE